MSAPVAERSHWLVLPDSPVLAVIDAAIKKQAAYHEAAGAFAAEFGTDRWYSTTNWTVHFLGLAFKKDPAEGWRLNKKKEYWTPDTRTKLGKEIAKRMRELPDGVAAATFSDMLDKAFSGPYQCWEGAGISWSVYERIGDSFLLSVPSGCKVTPPDCRELKMSEYWELREKSSGAETPVRHETHKADQQEVSA